MCLSWSRRVFLDQKNETNCDYTWVIPSIEHDGLDSDRRTIWNTQEVSLSPFLISFVFCTKRVFDGYLNCLRESFGNRLFIPVWAQLALYRPIQYTLQITLISWQILLLCAVLLLASACYQRVSVFVLSCCPVSYTR